MEVSCALLTEGVSKYVEFSSISFLPTSGGVNNIVNKAILDEGAASYILRIYNNGCDLDKVIYEHRVLFEFQKQHTSFQVPNALLSFVDQDSHVRLSDGSEASLFHVIRGILPKLNCAFEIGKACGELTMALANIEINNLLPTTPPYFEIYKVHHAVDRDKFFRYMASSELDVCRESADAITKEILSIEELIASLIAHELPMQLIHGDLHYDNILVDEGKVTGVLDFEFCAMDWRAMDLAICLSKYAGESEPMRYFNDIISGYKKFITLSVVEISAIANLIILRILSNVVYFVGRALSREDVVFTLTSRLDNYMKRVEWLRGNKANIMECFS